MVAIVNVLYPQVNHIIVMRIVPKLPLRRNWCRARDFSQILCDPDMRGVHTMEFVDVTTSPLSPTDNYP